MKKLMIAAAALLFGACATAPVENLPLESTQWKLTELYGESNAAFENGDSFTFTLDEGSITGKGSVNRFFGDYEYSDADGLKIDLFGMTRMMGPDVDLEDLFVRMFDEVDGCEIEGDVLTLTGEGKVLATFKAWTPDPDAEQVEPAGGMRVMSVDEALKFQSKTAEEE